MLLTVATFYERPTVSLLALLSILAGIPIYYVWQGQAADCLTSFVDFLNYWRVSGRSRWTGFARSHCVDFVFDAGLLPSSMSPPTVYDQPNDQYSSTGLNPDEPPPLPDLPPVEPPSAGFVVQLFVIPLVVVVVIIVWLLFGKLAGGDGAAMEYVGQTSLSLA